MTGVNGSAAVMPSLSNVMAGNTERPAAQVSENAALMARIAQLEAQVAKVKAEQSANIRFKVSEKGALSVYGLGRFPVTLYIEQWERLIGALTRMNEFVKEHTGEFKRKGEE